MSKWVRSGALAGAVDLVAELGGDFGALAAEAGLRDVVLATRPPPVAP